MRVYHSAVFSVRIYSDVIIIPFCVITNREKWEADLRESNLQGTS